MEEEKRPEEMPEMEKPLEERAEMEMPPEEKAEKKIYVEEREVRAGQLLDTINELIRESTVRRIRVKNKQGRVLLDIPVWLAAIGGVTAVITLPVLSAIGVLGGALAGVRIEIEREVEEKEEEKKEEGYAA